MLTALLFIAALAAAPYEERRAQAAGEGRLVPGDTAALVGLAGDLGCIAAHDPEDCAAMRVAPPAGEALVELVPVPALVIPAAGDQPASLLLPRFPYGLGEPVTPLLGPLRIPDGQAAWVRVPLPDAAVVRQGTGTAELLLIPDPTGPEVQPFVEPPGPPSTETLVAPFAADAWPPQLMPYTRVQVLLPLGIAAVRVVDGARVLAEVAWEAPPEPSGQVLATPAWNTQAVEGLALATGACMRAWYAETLRRPHSAPPPLPSTLEPPRLLVRTDALGQVVDAVALDAPWDAPEPRACLKANARLLPAAGDGGALAVLPLTLPARPPATPPATTP